MPRDLFGDVTRPSISIGSRKWYTLPLSLVSHSAIVLVLIAIPILAPAVMPSVFADDDMTLIKIELPKPPPVPKPKTLQNTDLRPVPELGAPTEAPSGISPQRPQVETGWEDRVPGATIAGTFDGAFGTPPPPEVKQPPQPVHVGGTIRPPQKIHNVDPVYSTMARLAGIQGVVIIEATIDENGQVINARLLRSIPLLDREALDAVRQWQFTPTLLNGVPVPVIMTVTVNFKLSR